MENMYLGKTGIRVSRLCLGTMTFGAQVSEKEGIVIINEAIDRGINFIDTANVYTQGQSEIITGKAIKGRRDEIILASKCGLASFPGGADGGLSRSSIIRNVDSSLKRMNVDHMDILYLHAPDYNMPIDEIIQTMAILINSGKILNYGVSNFPAWMCCSMIHKAKEMGLPVPVVTENVYNMITRGLDDEMVPFIKDYKIGLTTFNPLAGGLLTGKHRRGQIAENSRFAIDKGYAARYCKSSNMDALEEIVLLAAEINVPVAALAYKWLMNKDFISSVICGVSRMDQLIQNIDYCESIEIPFDILEKCDGIWNGIKGDYFNYHY